MRHGSTPDAHLCAFNTLLPEPRLRLDYRCWTLSLLVPITNSIPNMDLVLTVLIMRARAATVGLQPFSLVPPSRLYA